MLQKLILLAVSASSSTISSVFLGKCPTAQLSSDNYLPTLWLPVVAFATLTLPAPSMHLRWVEDMAAAWGRATGPSSERKPLPEQFTQDSWCVVIKSKTCQKWLHPSCSPSDVSPSVCHISEDAYIMRYKRPSRKWKMRCCSIRKTRQAILSLRFLVADGLTQSDLQRASKFSPQGHSLSQNTFDKWYRFVSVKPQTKCCLFDFIGKCC